MFTRRRLLGIRFHAGHKEALLEQIPPPVSRPTKAALAGSVCGSEPSPVTSEASLQPILKVENLTVGYRAKDRGQQIAVDGVTFSLAAGEAVGLLGESGSGKTTVGLALLGLLPPTGTILQGSAAFRGGDLLKLREREFQKVRGAAVSMVYQEPGSALNPVLRVGDQIAEVIRAHRPVTKQLAAEEAVGLLTQVGLSRETCVAAAYPHQLSGGQQQRVAIAQAIAAHPALLIADEPTTALDRVTQLEILDLLTSLRAKLGLALILKNHDPGVLTRTVERVMVMRNGCIVERGRIDDLVRSRNTYTQSLLNLSTLRTQRSCSASGNEPQDEHPCGPAVSRGEPRILLSAINLHKSYEQGRWPSRRRHQVDALAGVDLQLHAGATLALIGASGSGKSTLARCLACLERPDSGEIWFEKTNLAGLTYGEL